MTPTIRFRWGVFPIAKVAQEEEIIDLPPELVKPWEHLQEYFGSTSQSGNVMSSPILNFDDGGQHVFKANYGLSEKIVSSEKELARIFRDVEESVSLLRTFTYTPSLKRVTRKGPSHLSGHDSRVGSIRHWEKSRLYRPSEPYPNSSTVHFECLLRQATRSKSCSLCVGFPRPRLSGLGSSVPT